MSRAIVDTDNSDDDFDTHHFVKNLTQEGMPVKQAEILSKSQLRLYKRLVTKKDLAQLEAHLRKDTDDKLEKLELRINIKFESVNTKFESINTKFESINTKFENMNTKIEKMARHLILGLGTIVVGAVASLGVLFKFFPPMSIPPTTSIIIRVDDLKKALEASPGSNALFHSTTEYQSQTGTEHRFSPPAHKRH